MRNELWLLKNKRTNDFVFEYWASSQKHKALFAKEQNAIKACLWEGNEDFTPIKVTSNLLCSNNGCYCNECRYWKQDETTLPDGKQANWGYCNKLLDSDSEDNLITSEFRFCTFGQRKEPL